MASHYEAPIRKPLVTGDKSYHDVTIDVAAPVEGCLLYTSPSPRDYAASRMPSSA